VLPAHFHSFYSGPPKMPNEIADTVVWRPISIQLGLPQSAKHFRLAKVNKLVRRPI